ERDHATMLETLTHAQARGTELQDEARALRRLLELRLVQQLDASCIVVEAPEQFHVLVDLLKVRWRGDAKYGGAEAHADLPLEFGHGHDDGAREALAALRTKKTVATGHTCWRHIVIEE